MPGPDLNLLVTLDVLLTEGSVARAARRLRLSPSAMSRTLARLRATTGDPLLVRAGRRLVPSPRALELRDQVGPLVRAAHAALRPAVALEPARLRRAFTLRTGDGFVEAFGGALIERVAREAPAVRLRFLRRLDRDNDALRQGDVDLETGVVGRTTGPELRAVSLFHDRFVGAASAAHALFAADITAERYASAPHVAIVRDGRDRAPIDAALGTHGLARHIVASVDGFTPALVLARDAALVATVPERHTRALRAGLRAFELPVPVPPIEVSLLWHPRMDGDQAHRWLRTCVREVCAATS